MSIGNAPSILRLLERNNEINIEVSGYWETDKWDLKSENLMQFGKYTEPLKRRYVNFSDFIIPLKIELKFYYLTKLKTGEITLNTLISHACDFSHLKGFLKKYYPYIEGFVDIPENGVKKWKMYLFDKGLKDYTPRTELLKRIISFFQDYYDERDEFEKDIWDFRKIPGAKFTKNRTSYKLNFTNTPALFKELIKSYCKYKVSTNESQVTINAKLRTVNFFLKYILNQNPDWKSLNGLTRKEMEDYMSYLRSYRSDSEYSFERDLINIRDFLEHLERTENELGPRKSLNTLLFKEDFPKRNQDNNKIKHIPEDVIAQLESFLNTSPEELFPPLSESDADKIPIVILLLRTGWRISDILNLRYHNCLYYNNGWYLQGDIPKVDVKSHRVPIDEEVAKMIQAVVETTKKNSTSENNPQKYLFPTLKGKRRGLPILAVSVSNALNKWATNYRIVGYDRKPYYFRNHAFRHTKGIELVNAGMSILHIQKWMAHSSPEMTLVYAKITDDTLRKEWIKAKEKSNLLKIDINQGTISEVGDEDSLEWEYIRSNLEAAKVPMGYCMASKKMGCPYVETPCLTCTNFCTTPDNLPEFDAEINNLDSLIERTKDMPIWNEKNQKRKERLTEIRNTLAIGKIHHPAGKAMRERLKGIN
ncbi:tyrosine-type recombinase/integrase [Neobacillus rhizophilus]|uniref:Tyrosine-type recombinase/integrase n=1 Tax=Neobacillus rhizophilus TaxID=2833579 RepID=A0A942YX10_9BACI|nr:tyrosine-type recombinase/integrase [Neobacillus rhizophilus]MBS4214590.1 tyrosine-type recombinase/integrase [Neobacillus rhizophilus]